MDCAGSNPLVFGAPDIDLHATLRFTLENGFLRVLAQLSGDKFPNAEIFVTDGRGRARMLLTFETTSGPFTGPAWALPGNGTAEMNSLCIGFPVDGRGFPLKVGLIVAGVTSALAAAIVAHDGIWLLSVAVALPAVVLLLALAKGWPRIQLGAQVVLILELLVLGGTWPSFATLGALIALPAPVLGIICLVKRHSPRPGEIYVLMATLLASSSFLMQAIVLATRQR